MSFESFIAFKHLTRRHRTGFISLISMISILGVAVGVMALIVVLGVMSGFDRELKSKIVNVQPHLRIERVGGIVEAEKEMKKIWTSGLPEIRHVAAFVEGQAILRSQFGATGVMVKGLDREHEDLAVYQKHLVAGRLDLQDTVFTNPRRRFLFLVKRDAAGVRAGALWVGEVLAARLGVGVGDRVSLIAPFQENASKVSLEKAEVRPFVVTGIFRLGMSDFDSSLALISLPRAQELYHLGRRVTGISVRFADVDHAEKWKWRLEVEFPAGTAVRTWYDLNYNFFRALKVEKSVMTILLALIVFVAAFNIVSTLTMVVMEKTKDIGILRALGATRASIRKIFVIEGLSIGFFGVILGTVLGLVMAFYLNPLSDFLKRTTGLEVFPSDIYYFDRIPVQVFPHDVLVTVLVAVLASILAGYYPARRAAALDPAEALHYE